MSAMTKLAHHDKMFSACLVERCSNYVIYALLATPDSPVIFELRDNAGELACMSASMDDIVDAINGVG